jgi:hexosaminidase
MTKNFLLSLQCLLCLHVVGQQVPTIIPQPVNVKINGGSAPFLLTSATIVYVSGGSRSLQALPAQLNVLLADKGIVLDAMKGNNKPDGNYIELALPEQPYAQADEYHLSISAEVIKITGNNARAVFYGLQTLAQWIQPQFKNAKKTYTVPAAEIIDYPRFSYRGMHLDVARHFMPVPVVKKYIDWLARYKYNVFHWHLTEDQGWRIEIKKYPLLTTVGAWRNGTIIGRFPGSGNDGLKHGGFYTQDEIKEVVKYAADKHIDVIPEIEMPGHSSAAIAAYPQLSCFPDADTKWPEASAWNGAKKGKQVQQTWGVFEDVFCPSEYTFKFLEDVIDEVVALFPASYIHIGGDECPKEAWKKSAFCQQLMKEKGLKDEHELQSYFIQRMEKYINSKGKKIIGWDEILEGGLAPNATVMSWRGEEGGIAAAQQKHDVIMTPGEWCYFDHSQSKNEDSVTIGGYTTLEKVYSYEPVPAALTGDAAKYVLGAQANVWTEYIKYPTKLEYMIFPRMMALSEVLWTPKDNKNWTGFEQRLPAHLEWLDLEGIDYSKAHKEPQVKILPTEKYEGVYFSVQHKDSKGRFSVLDADKNGNFIYATGKMLVKQSGNYVLAAVNASNKPVSTNVVRRLQFNKATGKKITLLSAPASAYAGDGAFTLVDGVQNTKGRQRSFEFLGFNKSDCEVIIDLGAAQKISTVVVHCLHSKGDWIWRPQTVSLFSSADGVNFNTSAETDDVSVGESGRVAVNLNIENLNTRYLKLLIKRWGKIPAGENGAGEEAWMFVDEIEVL